MSVQSLADLTRPDRVSSHLQPAGAPDGSNHPWAMTPVAVGNCFGWLHTPHLDAGGDIAILLCPALTRDALDSHHAMRLFAAELASAGYPALRFDYPGFGDACDVTGESHWQAWQSSVHAAADWLRDATGARKIVFAGLRIGATLAALAAATRRDSAGLILLAPVLRGHSYMRQLAVEARMQHGAPAEDGLVFHELNLTAATVAEISAIDLRQIAMPAGQPIAIFSQSESRLLADCTQAWTANGTKIASAGFHGLEPFLRHNLVDECPTPDFSGIMAWLARTIPPAALPGPLRPHPAILHPPGCVETPLRFGADHRLFGMLCRPLHATGTQVVIIGNTGRDPHYGFGRFAVDFARRLASQGIASLRLDFSGIGDSIGPAGREAVPSHMFEADRSGELRAAIDLLEAMGFRRFAVQGMCAGAYHGLHAALADTRISTLLLINLPVFVWNPGDTVDFVKRKTSGPGLYLAQLGTRDLWSRLLRGKVDIGRLLRAQSIRLYERSRPTRLMLAQRLGFAGGQTRAQRAMATLAAHRTRTLFLFALDDGGYDAFEQEFGPAGGDIRAFDGAAMQVIAGVDHLLSTPPMRQAAADLMLAFLTAAP